MKHGYLVGICIGIGMVFSFGNQPWMGAIGAIATGYWFCYICGTLLLSFKKAQ